MELIVGKTAGFCFGVRNAIEKARSVISEDNSNIYCIGQLVHNERIMEELKKNGLVEVSEINEVQMNSKLIIRAHGVSPGVYEIAQNKKVGVIDLTCPKVARIHELAVELRKNNYFILFIAENNHPETIGTKGFCGDNSIVIECEEQVEEAIEKFKKSQLEKIAIIEQTTFSKEKFKNIENKIKSILDCEIYVIDTICNATSIRQEETESISKKVEFMIIIGGKNSANTKRLYEIACKNCKNAVLIQDKDDEVLRKILNKNTFNKIGIMAGASTPQECINELVNIL